MGYVDIDQILKLFACPSLVWQLPLYELKGQLRHVVLPAH